MSKSDTAWKSAWPWWLALGVALSPALFDAGALAVREWWARGSVVVALLAVFAMCEAHEPQRPGRHAAVGLGLVALGVAWTLVAAGGGMLRLARPAIPIAVLGLALLLGRPAGLRAALLFFAVAPPKTLMDALPGLHDLAGRLPASDGGPGDGGGFAEGLVSADGGLPLVVVLAGVGAFLGVRRGGSLGQVARRAVRCGLLALPIQAAALLLAWALWRAGQPELARFGLSHVVWSASVALLLLRGQGGRDATS
ncbi:MAG: hypothetical protein ACQGVC_18630 [Myxococcota bacterium]